MKRRSIPEQTELTVRGIDGFFKKIVTPFGTGAKIDCPKVYLGREVFIVVRTETSQSERNHTTGIVGVTAASTDPGSRQAERRV